jgi:hypothetical protein
MSHQRQLQAEEKQKTLSLFLSYEDEHQPVLNDIVEDFSNELKKIGALLRSPDINDYKAPDRRVSF